MPVDNAANWPVRDSWFGNVRWSMCNCSAASCELLPMGLWGLQGSKVEMFMFVLQCEIALGARQAAQGLLMEVQSGGPQVLAFPVPGLLQEFGMRRSR